MLLSECAIYGSKKSRLIKKQGASRILSSLGLKTPLSKIPLFGDILFNMYKMNKSGTQKFEKTEDKKYICR